MLNGEKGKIWKSVQSGFMIKEHIYAIFVYVYNISGRLHWE